LRKIDNQSLFFQCLLSRKGYVSSEITEYDGVGMEEQRRREALMEPTSTVPRNPCGGPSGSSRDVRQAAKRNII
jgi:hypothetical protein